jgi:Tfp pilus assembly protein PilF
LETDSNRLRNIAQLAREAGGADAAEPAYERLLKFDPANPEALHWLGVSAYSHARYSVAERQLGTLLKAAEGSYDDNFYLAEILWREGKRAEARTYYFRALHLIGQMSAPDQEAWTAQAQALFRCGYTQRALGEFRKLIAADRRNGDLRADFAALLIEAGHYGEAGDVLRAQVDSGAERMALAGVQLLSEEQRIPDARKLIESTMAGDPAGASVAAAFGSFEENTGRSRHAQDLFERAATLDPHNEDILDAEDALEKTRAAVFASGGELREIQGSQSESIIHLSDQSPITRALRVVVSADQDYVSIRSLRRRDGSSSSFNGIERRAEAGMEWEAENGTKLRASFFGGVSTSGGGLSVLRPDGLGSTSAAIEVARPDWDFAQSLAQGGVRDRVEVKRDSKIGSRTSLQAGAAVNRYDLPGLADAARSVSVAADANVRLLRTLGLSLDYSLDAEYILHERSSLTSSGAIFEPIPLVSREVHSVGPKIERQLTRGLRLVGSAGMAADRLGGRAPFVNSSLVWDRNRHLGARAEYDRRTYKYNSSQIATSLRGGLYWTF